MPGGGQRWVTGGALGREGGRQRGSGPGREEAVPDGPEQPVGCGQHDGDDGHAVDHALDAGQDIAQFRVQRFRQRHQDGGADHRPPDRGDAAEQRHHHRLRRNQHAEHRIRRHHQQYAGIEAAGGRSDHAGHDQCSHFPQPGVDTGRLGCQFVLPDREQREAEAGILHQHANEDRRDQQADRDQRVVGGDR